MILSLTGWIILICFSFWLRLLNIVAYFSDALVGVHCTHGLNRTGYFVCRWMVDRLKMDPNDAIKREIFCFFFTVFCNRTFIAGFNQARGHDIERKPLLDHLKKRNLASVPRSNRKNDYASPLSDATYDEPSNHNRYNRDRDRGHRGWREKNRSDNRERFSRQDPGRNVDRDLPRRPDNFERKKDRPGMRGGRRESSRADRDTNWRARDDRSNDQYRWKKPRGSATRTGEHKSAP